MLVTLDIIVTFRLNIENRVIFPQSKAFSVHYLISFKMCLVQCTFMSGTAQSFIHKLPEIPIMIGSPSDQVIECLESIFHYTLDNVVPLKRKNN